MKLFIDDTTFLGMNSSQESNRMSTKNFFVEQFNTELCMVYEAIGRCDDLVWSFPREIQDKYYPFMDRLHTLMNIQRIPYDEHTMNTLSEFSDMPLSTYEQLLLATVKSQEGILFTQNKQLLSLSLPWIKKIEDSEKEQLFPGDLEEFYQQSLLLRVNK